MKKYIKYISLTLFTLLVLQAKSQFCCPKFTLGANFQPCDSTCTSPGPNGGAGGNPSTGPAILTACKGQAHVYTVYPNIPGFTFTWTVIGGTPTSFVGNPITVTWGNSSQGFIQVIIKNLDSTCRDTITRQVCLVDGPKASFTFLPNPVCLAPSFVQFTNTSVGGSSYYWDFGDGGSSTLQNPTHAYALQGFYTVTLTVSTASGGSGGVALPPERDCKCRSTVSAVITVSNLKGIDIHPVDSCKRMLCTGDTTKYCTSTTGCTGLNWVVNGGTIISGQGTTCISVVWNQPSTYPTTVTLNATCPNTCGNSATISVPVLYPNLPIIGPSPVCSGSTTNYSLPVLPGTFYKWTLNGGGNIIGADSNINFININWTALGGSYIITCKYHNPYSGCSGVSTLTVTIMPKFKIIGPTPVCTTQTVNYFTNGPVNLWTFTPPTGFTNTPVGSNQQTMVWAIPGNYSIMATPLVPGNFCTPSATINIVVNPTPVLNPIAGPTLVCPNQLISYSVTSNTPGGQFSWALTSGTGNVSGYGPNNSNASVNFTGTGPWVLQASQTANGCTGIITLPINVVPPPSAITLSPPGSVCSGGTVTATVTGVGPFTWSSTPGAVLTGGQGTNIATFTVNSNATITVSNCGGFSNINVITSAATVTITPTPGPCSVTLTASPGGGTYAWFLNGNPAGAGISVIANQNGNWVVQATYPGGCQATAQYTVIGITPVVANITAIGSLCNSGSVTITAGIPANCPTPVFTWSNAFVGNPLVTNVPGNYFVTVTCSNGCSAVSNTIPVIACAGNGNGNGNCINDLVISPSNCNNPVTLTVTNTPTGCSSNTIAWDYGDGYGNATGIHLYNNVGTYTVTAVMLCGDGTKHCGTQNITIPMVDSFTSVISCNPPTGWKVQLQDASLYLPSYIGYTTTWTTSCGTLTPSVLNISTVPNPILTIPFGCNPTVTLTISKNGCTLTKSFTFSFPNTAFVINGPTTVCQNGNNNIYSSSYTTGVISYNWNFGDLTTGVTNPITHVFNGTPPNPTITLIITDQYGCQFTATQSITVIIPRALTITPSPLVKICPDCAPPVTLTSNPLTGFTGYQWYHNGVAIGGANSATYQLCNFDASGNYYVMANDALNNSCPVTSDTVKVVYLPKPVADIQGQTIVCSPTPTASFNLTNSVNDPNCTYVWTGAGPGTITYSPNNTVYNPFVTVSALGNYQFILTVTNTLTGCIAKDTFCLFVYQSPSVNIICPAGPLCAGTPYTFTAMPFNPNFVYTWSNGVTGQTMTTAQAGTYSVTVTNPISGCSAMSSTCTINERPNVSLFPLGCDTLCSKDTLIVPLPLGPIPNPGNLYTIQWYVDGNLYYTGPFLVLSGLSLGSHQIYIVVTNALGCSSTSAKYFNVFIKNCTDCDCKGSKWGDIIITQGNNPPAKLKCNSPYTLTCNLPYTINASFICKDTSCPGKVTYVLYPPSGSPILGNVPLTFTPVAGVYVLTLYGWCGGKKCDSCTIDLTVKCDCDCKESKWGPINVTKGDIGGGDNKVNANVVIGNPLIVKCNGTYTLNCNQPYTVNASYICKDTACNGKVTYSLQPPSGTPVTGNLPLTFTPAQSGVYILTLYGWCGNKICDSCIIKFNVKCDPCNCDGSHWGNISLSSGIPDDNPNGAVIGNPNNISLSCGKTYKLDCNKPYTFNANYICKDSACKGKVTYSLLPPTGPAITGNVAGSFTPTQSGTYVLTLYGWCGNKICDSCVIKFTVTCEEACDCKGSHWGDMTVSDGKNKAALTCKKEYPWKCKVPFTINAAFNCAKPNCPGTVTYTLMPPSGTPTSGNVPFTYTPTQSGTYTVQLFGMCGTTVCDTCVVKFIVDCPKDTNCCKHSIKIEAGNVMYTPTPNSTIAGQTFTISGMAGVNLSEVRAEVISYDLSSNFNNECLGCKTFPFTWASINSANNIGAVPPKITLFGGNTTTLFNPTGAAMYQNPREVIWNNSTLFTITGPVGINFILPPQPVIDCCELKGKICVKFTFRDEYCAECEAIVCFDVVIKKK